MIEVSWSIFFVEWGTWDAQLGQVISNWGQTVCDGGLLILVLLARRRRDTVEKGEGEDEQM